MSRYHDELTPERIRALASRKQGFNVSRYRWRDEKIAARCRRMVERGELRVKSRDADSTTYTAVKGGGE